MKKIRENMLLIGFAFVMMFLFVGNVYADCPLGPDVTEDLHGVLKVFNFLAPLLCIVFSIIELIKAITKGDAEGESKVVAKRFGKRMIYTLLLAFIPVLVDEVMTMAGFWNENGKCDLNVFEENGASGVNGTTTTKRQSVPDSCALHAIQECNADSLCFWEGPAYGTGGSCKPRCGGMNKEDCVKYDYCRVVNNNCTNK